MILRIFFVTFIFLVIVSCSGNQLRGVGGPGGAEICGIQPDLNGHNGVLRERIYKFDKTLQELSRLSFYHGKILSPGFIREDVKTNRIKLIVVMDRWGNFYGVDETIGTLPFDGEELFVRHSSLLEDGEVAFAGRMELVGQYLWGQKYWKIEKISNESGYFLSDSLHLVQALHELKLNKIGPRSMQIEIFVDKWALSHGPVRKLFKRIGVSVNENILYKSGKYKNVKLEKVSLHNGLIPPLHRDERKEALFYSMYAFTDAVKNNKNGDYLEIWRRVSSTKGMEVDPVILLGKLKKRVYSKKEEELVVSLVLSVFAEKGENLVHSGILLETGGKNSFSKTARLLWKQRKNDPHNIILDEYIPRNEAGHKMSWYSMRIRKLRRKRGPAVATEIVHNYATQIKKYADKFDPDIVIGVSNKTSAIGATHFLAKEVASLVGSDYVPQGINMDVNGKVVFLINDNLAAGVSVEKIRYLLYRAGAQKVYSISFGAAPCFI
ncbi:MAG: hypothetical protein KAQ98_05335 [Bacteriovoracaceae bacterium]|nr:hypothetical protein [Bacteriovoracaceae bacterium]